MKQKKTLLIMFIVAILSSTTLASDANIGQSAIITLAFPSGARSTGLGETFTGIADNVDAIFYNPAGLGQSPLSNSWIPHIPISVGKFTAITAPHNSGFTQKERIWVGTANHGLFLYNGKVWTSYDTYVIKDDDNLISIAENFLNTTNKEIITDAVHKISQFNKINEDKRNFLQGKLLKHLLSKDTVNNLINQILDLDESSQNAIKIYGIVSQYITDQSIANSLANSMESVFTITTDRSFKDFVELKIPFTIATTDTVTSLAIDKTNRLWVGTPNGLLRYDGVTWKKYTKLTGLTSNRIHSIAVSNSNSIAVGTDNGVSVNNNGIWESYDASKGLTENFITALAYDKSDNLLVGTQKGLFKLEDKKWLQYDETNGLLSTEVTEIYIDSKGKTWIGGIGGLAINRNDNWKKYKFPNTTINSIVEYKNGEMWIGTNQGAINYKPAKGVESSILDEQPRWDVVHGENGLVGNNVESVTSFGKDIWIVTDKAVNQRKHGQFQATLFYEPLLPKFNLDDLWHANLGVVYPTADWGTMGVSLNFLSFGKVEKTSADGVQVDAQSAFEFSLGLSYGLALRKDFSAGVNLKYAHSVLQQDDDGVARTFAVDLGLLKRNLFVDNFDVGFSMLNMGPPVNYGASSLANNDGKDPIPFTMRLGMSYHAVQTPIHSLLFALDLDREIVYKDVGQDPAPFYTAIWKDLFDDPNERWYNELEKVILHAGIEYWYVYFISLRLGYMHDQAGSRKEISTGLGLKYNDFNLDFSMIISPGEMSEARHTQWRFSFTYAK